MSEFHKFTCPKCGRFLVETFKSCKVLCPKCKIWVVGK